MKKSERDYAQDKLCRELGDSYRILRIDGERCIYRDFGNKFDVEISGTNTTSKRKKACIYLWYESRFTVTCIKEVPFADISDVVDKLYNYTCELYRTDAVTEESMRTLRYTRPRV